MAADSHASIASAARVIADIPCPFCGCVCDDLQATVAGQRVVSVSGACELQRAGGRQPPDIAERIVSVSGACELARPWFLGTGERPTCRIDGQPAELSEALQRAAELLCEARYPLVYGLSRATCEAQAAAVDIAETLGAVIDTPASRASLGALQSVGEVTCTLGEIRSRADLIVAWGADPIGTHPRFFERYTPDGDNRRLVVVDSRSTATGKLADQRIVIRDGSEFEAAVVLRGLAKGLPLNAAQVAERTGVALAMWHALWERMAQARYGVLLSYEMVDSPAARRQHEALAGLVRELNCHTRFVSLTLNSAGNIGGAANVLTWRTGYATAVDLSRGFPRSEPDEWTAEKLLAAGELDAALIVCDDPLGRFGRAAGERFRAIPTIAIDWQETATMAAASIAIPAALIGVESGGTVFRADGVPLALRPVVSAQLPADHEILRSLCSTLRSRHRQPIRSA